MTAPLASFYFLENKMLDKLDMPLKIQMEDMSLIKRASSYDKELWALLNKHKDFLGKYLNWPNRITTYNELVEETEKEIARWETGERFYYYMLCDNKLVGGVYVLHIDYKHHAAEFGYWLNPEHAGKAYVSCAVKVLEEHLFKQNIVRLVIRCDVENIASANVAQRNAYQLEGILKKNYCNQDVFKDNKLYAKINPDS